MPSDQGKRDSYLTVCVGVAQAHDERLATLGAVELAALRVVVDVAREAAGDEGPLHDALAQLDEVTS